MGERGFAKVHKALAWADKQVFGLMLNTRHPRKFKWIPPEKKVPADAVHTGEDGAEKVLTSSDSASNDNT